MRRGPLFSAIGAAILIWGFVFIPLKHLTSQEYTDHPVSPQAFLVLRFLPLLPVFAVLLARHLRSERPGLLRRDWPWMAAMGLFMIPFYHLPFNYALATPIHTGLISLILNTSPALTYFFAVAFRQERLRRERTMGVLLAFVGLALIFAEEVYQNLHGGSGVAFSWLGAGLALVSATSWSLFTLIGRRLSRDHSGRLTFAASGLAATLAILVAAPFFMDSKALHQYLALGSLDWLSWAYVSLLAAFFSYWVWVLALQHFEASRLASIGNLIPLLVHAFAALFLPQERKAFTPVYIAGAAVTLAGMALVIRRRGGPVSSRDPIPPRDRREGGP